MNISFTGHRQYDKERFDEALRAAILEFAADEPTLCYSGVAVGFDLAAAECVLTLRDEGFALQLCCVIPFAGQAASFSAEDRARYDAIIKQADSVIILSEEYRADTFHRRNDYLVAHAEAIITYYEGASNRGKIGSGGKGGTAYTLRRARNEGLAIKNIYPSQQLTLFCEG
ncbi:MAG: SLOG family protein [Rikenellaceae bacterium]